MDFDQLQPTVVGLVNNLLDNPLSAPIEMERIHCALRPLDRESDPPPDVVCCLTSFKLKEEILRKARNRTQISHGDSTIHIFQDLSTITFQHRKDLRPLLDALRTKGIHYRWKFPFHFSASTQGHMAFL